MLRLSFTRWTLRKTRPLISTYKSLSYRQRPLVRMLSISSLSPKIVAIKNLPFKLDTHQGGPPELLVDSLKEGQISRAYDLVTQAAERGDNVGLDEYPSIESFRSLLYKSQAFGIVQNNKEDLQAVAIISPCRITRGYLPTTSEIIVFLSKEHSGEPLSLLSSTLPLLEKVVVDLGLGYTSCVIQVAISCVDWIVKLRDLGYNITGCITKSVDIATQGLVDNLVYYKELTVSQFKKVPLDVVRQLPEIKHYAVSDEQYDASSLLHNPYLPLRYSDQHGKYLLRQMHKHEDREIYQLYVDAAQEGLGYSYDEFPTLQHFRHDILLRSYPIVVEDESTGKMGGLLLIRPSLFMRNTKNLTCSHSVVTYPSFRSKKMLYWFLPMAIGMSYQLGYRHLITSGISTHYYIHRINCVNGYYIVANVPNGMYVEGQGRRDVLAALRPLTSQDVQQLPGKL